MTDVQPPQVGEFEEHGRNGRHCVISDMQASEPSECTEALRTSTQFVVVNLEYLQDS